MHQLLYVVPVVLFILVVGVAQPGDALDGPVARVVWIAACTALVLVFVVPVVRFRLVVTPDGIMTKRALRTSRVDLTKLFELRTRGDRPWEINLTGVLTFVDADGGSVEVPLVAGPWAPSGPLFAALAAAIERSGLPMSGIVGAQLEMYVERPLQVDDTNRAALRRCRDQVRRGETTPYVSIAGWDTTQLMLLSASPVAVLVGAAAASGASPPDAATVVAVVAWGALATLVGAIVWRRSERLELRQDAVLTRRRSRVALPELTTVELTPDRPHLQRTAEGRRPTGRRPPSLRLRDAAGGSLTIHLGGRWQAPVPILRYVLAAAEERAVPLSEHARYELEFYLGLTGRRHFPDPTSRGEFSAG